MGFNKFCKKIGFTRNLNCDTNEYGGKYEIINLYDYIIYQKKEYNTKFKFKKKDDTIYVLFYRFDNDEYYGKNILKDFYDYKTLVKKYMKKEYIPGWNFPSDMIDGSNEQWGHTPGIGINLSFFPMEYYMYETGKTISEFWIPIKRNNQKIDISVCCIPGECTWTQISCDEKNTLRYDMIAHIDTSKNNGYYNEINITDRGRTKVEKIIQCKYNDKINTFLFSKDVDNSLKEKKIVYNDGTYTIVEEKVLDMNVECEIDEFKMTKFSLDDLKDIEKR